ncbi:MAG: hypothetical protein JSR45_16750 [Proteobacteria bacterium]|nr:hypothetical protein [Pseudomonadota bacterium]
MKPILMTGLALAALGAATAVSAQETTTVVRHTRHVEDKTTIQPVAQVEEPQAPVPDQIHTRTVVHRKVVTHRGYHAISRRPVRHHVVHHAVRHAVHRSATATETDMTTTTDTSASSSADTIRGVREGVVVKHEPVVVDHTTVIRHHDDGVVTRRDRVTRTHPDGTSTTVVKHSARIPTDPPPPPPVQQDPDNPRS